MYVKQCSFILSLAIICVASADIESAEAVKSEVENVSEEVFRLAKTCVSDVDCHHLGKCVATATGKFCKCKSGTSGDLCEKVDECVDNPVKCGEKDDVSCVFDIEKEKAVCKCDNDTKTYVEDEERCMSPCLKYDDCGIYGTCYHKIGNKEFCACELGTSGDYCEIIDACHNKLVDCGVDNNATCTLGGKGKAYCSCDDVTKGFDYNDKTCKDCSGCGASDISFGRCNYRDGIRICACKSRYFSNKLGICEGCKCGLDSYGCKIENGTKICQCRSGAANKNGFCQKCDCGSGLGVSNCELKDDKKVCTCKEGYTLIGPDGPCKQMCNVTNPCENGGKCVQSMCNCLKGTSGDLCKTVTDCKSWFKCQYAKCLYNETSQEAYCKCEGSLTFDDNSKKCKETCNAANPCANGGKCVQNVCNCLKGTSGDMCKTIDECQNWTKCRSAKCLYNETSQEAYCKCEGSLIYDDYFKTCKECDCGIFAKSCTFLRGKKKCTCSGSYQEKLGKCTYCSCMGKSKPDGCKFDDAGNIKCECFKGYAQVGGECKDCDCGEHGQCSLSTWATKSCTCDEGYVEDGGMCKECDCGKNGKCSLSYDGKKTCTCSPGYKEYQGTCKGCSCYYNSACDFDKWGNPQCTCQSGYGMKDGVCTPCNCYPGTSCTFGETNRYATRENKVCHCPKGYADNNYGKCSACDCEAIGSNCSYSLGYMRCECPKGYKVEDKRFSFWDKICKDIDECKNSNSCPQTSTNCVNTPGSYHCECKAGYESPNYSSDDIKKYGCQDINECVRDLKPCSDSAATCLNTPGSYRCVCRSGYWMKATDEKRNVCGAARPWRTATIILGVISTIIIVGLLIAVGKQCRSL